MLKEMSGVLEFLSEVLREGVKQQKALSDEVDALHDLRASDARTIELLEKENEELRERSRAYAEARHRTAVALAETEKENARLRRLGWRAGFD